MMARNRYLKHGIVLVAALLAGTALRAQAVEFSAIAPRAVETGVPFRVEFRVNAEVEAFTPPDFAGTTVLAGPSTSRSLSTTAAGGKITRSVTTSFTYVLRIDEPGTVTIPEAVIRIDKEEYRSRPVAIEATGEPVAPQDPAPEAEDPKPKRDPQWRQPPILI
jgi:hypothetical protein